MNAYYIKIFKVFLKIIMAIEEAYTKIPSHWLYTTKWQPALFNEHKYNF